MAKKQKTRKEPLQNIPVQNSFLINLVCGFQGTLTLFGLYKDFRVHKYLENCIRILRQRNTDMTMILYKDNEERIYQQKSQLRRLKKEVTTSQPQYRLFLRVTYRINQGGPQYKLNIRKVCNTQLLQNENQQLQYGSPIENIISLKTKDKGNK